MADITKSDLTFTHRNHTGAVYYGTGTLPYTAALNGLELKTASGKYNRVFKTAKAAEATIVKAKREG